MTAVFENLLPDSETLRPKVAEQVGAARSDAYGLLAAIGADCVGALQFVSGNDEVIETGLIAGEPVDNEAIERILKNLSRAPLGLARDDEFRISIAGAQEKTALLRFNGQWLKPHGTTPTTHILKPQIGEVHGIDLANSVENEFYCLRLLAAFGLPVAKADMQVFAATKALVVERFDRRWTKDGRLLRLPQEDCCQALSVPPSQKYESDGGPGVEAIIELLNGADDPAQDHSIFFKTQILFWLIGATDGHAKNFSVYLSPGGGYRLTPLYDVLTAQPSLEAHQNRINPELFSAAFTAWVRESWPERPDLIAIDGKTSRRSHDRADDKAPLHLVSAFATTSRLVLGQEAVAGKSNELQAIPVLLDRLAEGGALKGALVSIDAIATNARIAQAIKDKGADYLLAVKANQPTLRKEMEEAFAAAKTLERDVDHDKGHGRIERRSVSVINEVDWLDGDRRFPGELRLPHAATLVRVQSRAELCDRSRFETRYYISSAKLSARKAAEAVRGHWGIENQLHWVLDVVFAEDQARLRKGHGARNMAVVRHFAINMIRSAEPERPPPMKPQRKATKPPRTSIKLRRKIASWRNDYLAKALAASPR